MKKTMCHEVNLIEHVPFFMKDVEEFKQIVKAENPEFDLLLIARIDLMCNQFVEDCTEYGLKRWERMLGLSGKDSLETRRIDILTKLNIRLPYSYRWLINLLNTLVGEENYVIDVSNYKVTIEILAMYEKTAIVLNYDLRKLLPANLIIDVSLFQTEQAGQHYFGGFVHSGDNLSVRQVI